jgi:IS5 family transposase
VSAPVQRNSRAENKAIKDGDPPVAWTPNKKAQKDVDARWTKEHGKSYLGYKNHVNIDRKHKLMRRYTVTNAAVHDSQTLDALLDPHNPASNVWADTAYRSKETEEKLAQNGLRSRIHRRASRGKPLSQRAQEANRTRSKGRARVEPVFGHQHTRMGGTIVRTIGLVRAKAKIGLMNLVYNISRFAFLERTATPA